MRRFGPSSAVARLFGVTFVFLCTDVVISSGLGRQSGCTWEESSKAAAVGGDSLPPRLFRPNQSSPDVHVDYIVYSVTSNWHQVAVTGTPFPSEQRLEALDSFLVRCRDDYKHLCVI